MKWYNLNRWLPFTLEGRATLMYMMFAGAGPAVLLALIYVIRMLRYWEAGPVAMRLTYVYDLADKLAWGVLVVLITLACFISIRAFKLNVKTGTMDVDGNSAPAAAQAVADASQEKADEIKDAVTVEKADGQ